MKDRGVEERGQTETKRVDGHSQIDRDRRRQAIILVCAARVRAAINKPIRGMQRSFKRDKM